MLNAKHGFLEASGRTAADRPSPFSAEAESIVAGFRAGRKGIEEGVRRGDVTPRAARAEAAELASGLARTLKARAAEFSATPRVFLDRLVEAAESRKAALDHASLETLQRETNRLLRSVLIEQQIQVRASEFESKAYTRPVAGGQPAPTLGGLLAFGKTAADSGDEAAREWVRRRLEEQRPLASSEADVREIDLATDRPDRINPRLVEGFIEGLRDRDHSEMERFVAESVASRDASACTASFLLARDAAEGTRLRWVRQVLEGVAQFPDVALNTLRSIEAEARATERADALAHAEFAAARVEAEAKLPGLVAPTEAEAARRAEVQGRPVARPGEPIGLALERRGSSGGEATAPAAGVEFESDQDA